MKRQLLVSSSIDQYQPAFLNRWLSSHFLYAQYAIRKPIPIAEFGKSFKDSGYNTYQRDHFSTVCTTRYTHLLREEGHLKEASTLGTEFGTAFTLVMQVDRSRPEGVLNGLTLSSPG
ncbi:unnamed protein product [Lupinus luteus]|uniref:Uncharacterized protein n=1 Tax=Lupinus luteus TaxID=3873 RepID=A0AAV1X108_LUPLU